MMELDSKRASTNEVTGKLERKTITTSSNSIGSVPHSEDYSSVSGLGREIKKRIASKYYIEIYTIILKKKKK